MCKKTEIKECENPECLNLILQQGRNHVFCGERCRLDNKNNRRKLRGYKMKRILIHLAGGCCKECGYNSSDASLCFHHLRDKKFTLDVSNLCKKPWEEILLELDKCELMCHNCHAIHHEIERIQNANRNIHSEDQYQRGLLRKQELIGRSGGSCAECNYGSNYTQVFSFDHINPSEKSFELNMRGLKDYSMADIDLEFEKCRLLCMNCHMAMNPYR